MSSRMDDILRNQGGTMQVDAIKKAGQWESDSSFSSAQENSFFTILVVDPKASLDAVLEDFLKTELQYSVRARSAEEALAATRQFQPDLILLNDSMKALLDGLLMEQPSAAVILMAEAPSISGAVDAMRQGAVDYLELPMDLQKLRSAILLQKSLSRSIKF
jgi:DNA-binding NtrC family response regulator